MQKLLLRMMLHPHETVTAAYVAYMRKQNNNKERGRKDLVDRGFEQIDTDLMLLPDGREVFNFFDKKWVLRKDLHDAELKSAIDEEVSKNVIAASSPDQLETKSVAGTEVLGLMVCPICGDSLQCAAVCPSCAAGKIGYRYRYSCISGHVDFVSKEKI